jgi:adenylate cyclase
LEYAAVGSVTNLASRLCDEARAGQIIVSQRAYGMVQDFVEARPIGDLHLKGFSRPVAAMEILTWRDRDQSTIPPPAVAARNS